MISTMNFIRFFCCFFLLLLSQATYAWNATGHKLIAQIAYDQLSKTEKQKIEPLLRALDEDYPKVNFVYSAVWADWIKYHDEAQFNHWHYIDLPYSPDGSPLPEVSDENIAWAINQTLATLEDNDATLLAKGRALRFLIHFIGDIHQPLHCTNRVTHRFPEGDNGGNSFHIVSKNARNLHSLWDAGVGLFDTEFHGKKPNAVQILRYALSLEHRYPKARFNQLLQDWDTMHWAEQGEHLAKEYAYSLDEHGAPSEIYTQRAQVIVKEQIVLAGYRLAAVLHMLYQ